MDGDQGRVSGLGVSKALDEVKARRRDSQHLPFFIVTTGEGISDDVRGARPVLHREIEAQELADLVVLRDGGEALVEEVLQVLTIKRRPQRYGRQCHTAWTRPMSSCS
jgi:hypothetical protein